MIHTTRSARVAAGVAVLWIVVAGAAMYVAPASSMRRFDTFT